MKLKRVREQDGRYYYIQDLEERHAKSGRPKQKWHGLTRVDEGEPALIKALDQLLGEPTERRGNLPAHVEDFKKVHLPGLSESSLAEYTRMYAAIAKGFAEFDSAQVEPGDIEKFLAGFAAQLNTRGKYKARLSTFFSWCVRNSYTGVKVNPCREIRLSQPPPRKGKMTGERYWKIHEALTPVGQCFMDLTYLSRQRPTEIRLLRESQIGPHPELGDEYIHFVPTKTEDSSGEEVWVLVTPEIRAALERARSLWPKPKVQQLDRRRDPFLIQTRAGDCYSKTGLYEVWRDAIDAAGYKGLNITTRDLRAFAGAMMKKLGYTKEEIQQAYAHTTVRTTEIYLDQHRDRVSIARLPLPARPR